MTTLREVHAAYQDGQRRAKATSTVRLRFAERRIRRHQSELTPSERAFLKALRDELRDRGIEVTA
jgi:hypothetical protein